MLKTLNYYDAMDLVRKMRPTSFQGTVCKLQCMSDIRIKNPKTGSILLLPDNHYIVDIQKDPEDSRMIVSILSENYGVRRFNLEDVIEFSVYDKSADIWDIIRIS